MKYLPSFCPLSIAKIYFSMTIDVLSLLFSLCISIFLIVKLRVQKSTRTFSGSDYGFQAFCRRPLPRCRVVCLILTGVMIWQERNDHYEIFENWSLRFPVLRFFMLQTFFRYFLHLTRWSLQLIPVLVTLS